jgi:hypothetical protein
VKFKAAVKPCLPVEYLDETTVFELERRGFKGKKRKNGRFFYKADAGSDLEGLAEYFAVLIESKLQENREDYPACITIECAVSNRMLSCENIICGGEAFFITAFHVKKISTDDWIKSRIKEYDDIPKVELF